MLNATIEPNMRQEIVEFKRICDNLLGSSQQHDWALTEKERKVAAHYVQELQEDVFPIKEDSQPLAMPLSAIPPIID